MIQLYYAKKRKPLPTIEDDDLYFELSEDVVQIEFENINDASYEVTSLLQNGDNKTVYVITLEFNDSFDPSEFKSESEIYIGHNSLMVEFFLTSHLYMDDVQNIFLYEYYSYESAYEIALDLREVNELCYE